MLALLCAPTGQRARLVDSAVGRHGELLQVVESDARRVLLADDIILGAEYSERSVRDQACFSGFALMQAIAFLVPAPRSVLSLGLGVGTVPAFLRPRGIRTDAVDYDAAVLALAQAHFLIGDAAGSGPGRLIEADARDFVRAAPRMRSEHGLLERSYDALLCDLYAGDVAFEMLTSESLGALKRTWLRGEGGVMVVNVMAFFTGPHVALARDVVRTVRSVFAHVDCFVDRPPDDDPHAPTNLVVYASDAPLRFEPPRAADPAEAPPGSTYHLWEHFARWRPAELQAAAEGRDGRVMHDADLSAAATAGQTPYGEERAALRAAMETLQRMVMHDDGWELVRAGVRAHRHDLRPLNGPRASTAKAEL